MSKTREKKMNDISTSTKIANFNAKMKESYEFKVLYAERRAREFVDECNKRGLNYYVSVGGLDSITLYLFLKSIGINCPAVSVSSLEDPSVQAVHRQLGVINVPPLVKSVDKETGKKEYWTKQKILQEYGFPVISKKVAQAIELFQKPTEKNINIRNEYIFGTYTDKKTMQQRNSSFAVAQKWLKKFGGYENERLGTDWEIPPFKVSAKCCKILKERPLEVWQKEHNSVPFLGLMASEGGRRELWLKTHGCNYFGKSTIRSAPFAIFERQDLLQLALDLNVPVPKIYGTIERKEDGTLYTTGSQRTGCSMCGFGIHMEERPHRFDTLKERNPKEWQYWMYECCTDENGEKYGWARVLDYIGVEY